MGHINVRLLPLSENIVFRYPMQIETYFKWRLMTRLLVLPRVREDVAKVFNLRLPEPDLLKLKYIADHTPDSMQQFCQRVLLPAIEAKIQELTEPR